MVRYTRKPKKGYYHYGYYWGPGWSAGQYQDSVDYKNYPNAPTPVDWNDRSAAQHDARYAQRMKQGRYWFGDKEAEKADYRFAWRGLRAAWHPKNKKLTTRINDAARGIAGAVAVGGQGVLRRIYRITHPRLNKLFS